MSETYYQDIDFSFERSSTGDVPKLTNIDAVKASIYNELFIIDSENYLTNTGWEYGLYDSLFDINDSVFYSNLIDLFQNLVDNDPRIRSAEDIVINANPDNNELTVTLFLVLINEVEPQEVNLILKKTR